MRKMVAIALVYSLIAFSLTCVVPCDAKAEQQEMIAENFESCEVGAYSGKALIAEKRDAVVVEDNGNHLCCVSITGETGVAKGSVFTSKNITVNEETVFSFKIRNGNSTQGSVLVTLRADYGSANEYSTMINFVSIGDGVIKYLPQMTGVTEEIADDQTASITVTVNPVSGKINIYRDGNLKSSVEDYKTLHGGSWSEFYMQSCLFRFQTFVKATPVGEPEPFVAKTYLDDILCSSDMSESAGVFASDNSLYYTSSAQDGGLYRLNELKDGVLKSSVLFVNETSEVQNVRMLLAHMRGNRLFAVQLSEERLIDPQKAMSVDGQIEVNGSVAGDTLEVFLFNSLSALVPLTSKSMYQKPSIDKPIYNELEYLYERHGQSTHPRIIASAEDFDRIRNSTNLSAWKQSVISEAEEIVSADIDSAGEYQIDYNVASADTLLYMAQRVRDFVEKLGMSYQITGESRYVDKAYQILSKAGNFRDWYCNQFLGTAEMTGAFAIGYDWMYEGFSPAQRAEIEGYIKNKGVLAGKAAYDRTGGADNTGWWQFVPHNWNVVCNSGMIMGAVAIADISPELSFYVIEKAIDSLKYALASFAPDGAWAEGYDYVEFVFQTLANADCALSKGFGTDFGITSYDGMDKAGDFLLQMVGTTYSNNFHDSWLNPADTPQILWLAKLYNKPEYAVARLRSIEDNNLAPSVYDLLFYDESLVAEEVFPSLDAYFRGVEYVSSRSGWDSNALWLSYHGGKVVENHSHADCGAFIFEAMGERWACDLGADNYNATGYFDEGGRYLYYRTRTEGHNTLVIDPDESAGQELDADTKVIEYSFDTDEPYSVLDLTPAYKSKASSVKRTYKLLNNRTSAVIKDEICLISSESIVYWFMHTKADVNIINESTAELTLGDKKLKVEVVSDAQELELSCKAAEPLIDMGVTQNNGNQNYRKLQIKMSGSSSISLTVKLTPIS